MLNDIPQPGLNRFLSRVIIAGQDNKLCMVPAQGHVQQVKRDIRPEIDAVPFHVPQEHRGSERTNFMNVSRHTSDKDLRSSRRRFFPKDVDEVLTYLPAHALFPSQADSSLMPYLADEAQERKDHDIQSLLLPQAIDPVLKQGDDGVHILTPGGSNRLLNIIPIDAGDSREIHGDMLHRVQEVVLTGLSQLPDGFAVIQL